MESNETLKRRIRVSKELRSIVRTMKSLAAVSMRQSEWSLQALDLYRRTIELGFAFVLDDAPLPVPAMTSQTMGVIVFGSDQGLCGGFNERVATFAAATLRDAIPRPSRTVVASVGDRVLGPLEDQGLQVERSFPIPGSTAGVTPIVQELLGQVDQWLTRGQLDQVVLFYSRAMPGAAVAPELVRLIPVELSRSNAAGRKSRRVSAHTMPRPDLLAALIREHLFATLYEALVRSIYAENLNRFTTASAAEKNIDEVFRELQGRFHLQRQAAVTAELLDLSVGVESLR